MPKASNGLTFSMASSESNSEIRSTSHPSSPPASKLTKSTEAARSASGTTDS